MQTSITRGARQARQASTEATPYPFPQLLLDFILSQHVLVYFFTHDDSIFAPERALRSCLRGARGSGRLKKMIALTERARELALDYTHLANAVHRSPLCHSAVIDPSRKLSSALDMNGRMTDTSMALMFVSFTPLSAFSSRLRKPA